MIYTLSEIIVVIIAFIILSYYIYTVKTGKCINEMDKDSIDDNDDDDKIEHFEGQSTCEQVNMLLVNDKNNYAKMIIDKNNRRFDIINIRFWIPFIATKKIFLDNNDIDILNKAPDLETAFNLVIYPKIYIIVTNEINKMEKLKKKISNITQSTKDVIDRYIKFLKLYIIYYNNIVLNLLDPKHQVELKNTEDLMMRIENVLRNLK